MPTSKQPRNETPLPHDPDDFFWAAFFDQEALETFRAEIEAPPLTDSEKHNDGRFRWSDGGVEENEDEAWHAASRVKATEQNLYLMVTGANKDGLLVSWQGLQGFVPASQLKNFPELHVARAKDKGLKERIGQFMWLRVTEVDRRRNRLILSERRAEATAADREIVWSGLSVGDRRYGRVTNLARFGAFVDLGAGVEGMIHLSEFSWALVGHPSEMVSAGQQVEVLIIGLDRAARTIQLSLKRLRPNPWSDVASRYVPGQIVEGTVARVKTSLGVFVRLEPELDGLVHVSELTDAQASNPTQIFTPGQRLRARVLEVDGLKKRLALSIRQT